jgi:hypothetical protein
MNSVVPQKWLSLAAAWGLFFSAAPALADAPVVLFETGFEFEEGYNPTLTLAGQNGWVSFGTGGNGLVTNLFEGFGQQAFIGFFQASDSPDDVLNVWRPINYHPVETSHSIVTFSVMMQIVDSTNERWDDFRWSVYNAEGEGRRLFTIDFDNHDQLISYALDDGQGFFSTGLGFDNEGYYDLVVIMNFARNLWSAWLNDEVIINSQPITTVNAPLSLGDIDAVWAIRNPGDPGDNFMLFDDYRIVAEPFTVTPPVMEAPGLDEQGRFVLRVHGEPGLNYRVEGSSDLVWWDDLGVFQAPPGGTFELEDAATAQTPHHFFRVRLAQ